MTEKKINMILFLSIVAIFAALMLAQYLMLFAPNPNVEKMLMQVVECTKKEDWVQASTLLTQVEKTWNAAQPLVAIKYADSDFTLLNVSFKGLRAAIDQRDKVFAQKDGAICIMLFKNITSISPKP